MLENYVNKLIITLNVVNSVNYMVKKERCGFLHNPHLFTLSNVSDWWLASGDQ